MRTIPGKMRTDEVYAAAFGSIIFINIGLHASKRGTRSCAAVSWRWRSASDVCRYSPPEARVLWVRRWHEGVGTDEEPAWALGYASSGCVSQKLRPTACGRQ